MPGRVHALPRGGNRLPQALTIVALTALAWLTAWLVIGLA